MGIVTWFDRDNSGRIFPDYGRIRIENYAEAFRDLAFNFTKFDSKEIREGESRSEYLTRRKESEHWKRLGERFSDAAIMMNAIAGECYSYRRLQGLRWTYLHMLLRREGIVLKDAYIIKNRWSHREYCLSMQMAGNMVSIGGKSRLCETEKVSRILSGVFGKGILPADNCPLFIGDECREYLFAEQGNYRVSTGKAVMTKSGEAVSGDNYSFLQGSNGKMTVLLSDGVGSGEEACRDSSRLIDLAEKYIEIGFDKRQTMGILEGVMMGNSMENRMPTLDLCEIDLFTGECEFAKLGSAPSLIKYDRLIDEVTSQNLLLGYEHIGDVVITRRQLKEDNYVILMTDGVADYFKETEKTDLFKLIIGGKGYEDPTVIANYILDKAVSMQNRQYEEIAEVSKSMAAKERIKEAGQMIRDDMTVLVLKIEETVH